jgi:hypothetical protein
MDMVHGHLLLALPAMAVEGFGERRIGAEPLIRLGKACLRVGPLDDAF